MRFLGNKLICVILTIALMFTALPSDVLADTSTTVDSVDETYENSACDQDSEYENFSDDSSENVSDDLKEEESDNDTDDETEDADDITDSSEESYEDETEDASESDTDEEQTEADEDIDSDSIDTEADEETSGVSSSVYGISLFSSKASTASTTSTIKSYSYTYTYTSINSVTLSPSSVTTSKLLSEASSFIASMEGSYSTVVANDNGALSIGKIQWHGANALQLVRLIVSEDNESAYDYLGETLYNEVISSSTTWSTKIPDSSEVTAISNLISSTAGKKIQDKLLDSYISSYINHATALGIRNAAVLLIYADLENQRGYSGAKTTAAAAAKLAGSYASITANEMLMASICCYSTSVSSLYTSFVRRRLSAYSYVVGLGWTYCSSGDYMIAYNSTVAKTTGLKWIQSTLNKINSAGLSVDGVYGSATEAAIMSFQSSRGLDVDGIVGQNTITAMITELYEYLLTGQTSNTTSGTTNVASTLAISSYTYPSSITEGSSFSIKGAIKSNYTISKVTVKVVNSSGKTVLSASATPKAKSYNVSSLDSKIKFGTLSAGTYTYKVSATDTKGTKTLVKKTFKVVSKCKLAIKSYNYPSSLKYGKSFSIKGTVSSNVKITKVTVKVVNSGGKTVLSASAKPNAKSYSIKKLDAKIKFGTLAVGTYKYKVVAKDSNGSKTLVNKTFKVKTTSTLKIKSYNYPKSIKKGKSFSIKGTITSNCKISKVTVKVINSSGKTVLSASAKPNAKSYSIKKLDAKIKFGKLSKGTYTYKVTAKDSQITKTLVKKTFKVK